MVEPLWKTVQQFLKRLNEESPCDPVIPLLGTNPRKMEIYAHGKSLYINVDSSIIQTSQKVETAQMSINQ